MFADLELVEAIKDGGFQVMMETNGSIRPGKGVLEAMSYISVRPKLENVHGGGLKVPDLDVLKANELVITLPGAIGGRGWTDEQLYQVEMEGEWGSLFVVPMDPTDPRTVEVTHLRGGYERHEELNAAVQRCLDWVRENPKWRLCIQLQKVLNL
jgi:organic radical activating enzyme